MKRYYYKNVMHFTNTGAAVKVDSDTDAEQALIKQGWERITRREAENITHHNANKIDAAYINIYGLIVY